MKKSSILCLGLMLALIGCETSGDPEFENGKDVTVLKTCLDIGGVFHSENNKCTCTKAGTICINNVISNVGIRYLCEKEGDILFEDTEDTENAGNESLCSNVSCNIDFNDCGECLNGSTRCEIEGGLNIMSICRDGKWHIDNDLEVNFGNNCTCNRETTICRNNAEGIGKKYTCEKDQKSEKIENCLTVSCDDNNNCGECKNGATKCENGELSKCEHGEWQVFIACENSVSCNAEGTDCGYCKTGDTKEGDISQNIQTLICENGAWKVESCIPPYIENEGKCVECLEDKCILLTSQNLDSELPKRCELHKEIVLAFAKQKTSQGGNIKFGKFVGWINPLICKDVILSRPEDPSLQDCIDVIENFPCTETGLKDLGMQITSDSGLSVAMKCDNNQWKVAQACTKSYESSPGTYSITPTQCSSDKKTCESTSNSSPNDDYNSDE